MNAIGLEFSGWWRGQCREGRRRWLATAPLLVLILLAGVLLAGCDAQVQEETSENGEHTIVATTGMVADIVRQVVGERATVHPLMKEGVDPHQYQPTRNDVVKLQQADAVFYNGLLLEGRMTDVFVKLARSGKPVFAVTEMIADDYVISDEGNHYDPHVWMDVRGWVQAVEVVADAMAELDPEHADQYRDNATAYIERLEQLDAFAGTAIASIPREQRVLVTAHDAFQYFGRAYDIEVRGIQGISTESEAGIRDINTLVEFLVQRNIPAVFVESSVNDDNVRALIEGAASRGHTVKIGGELFSDAMGPAGTYEGTYIGMIDHNVTTIVQALGGELPPRTFHDEETRSAAAESEEG